MYEPTQSEISDKIEELLDGYKNHADILMDVIAEELPLLRAVLTAGYSQLADRALDLSMAIDKRLISCYSLEEKAREMLIAEVGYTIKIAEDDYKFVYHDTRY